MNYSLDVTEDEIERIKEWEAKHSIRISVDESDPVAVDITFHNTGDGVVRLSVDRVDAATGHWLEKACALLTPQEASRLSDLLLAVAAEGAPK